MSVYLNQYKEQVRRLHEIRIKNGDAESEEEDRLLDEMDVTWLHLKPEERALIDRE